MKPRTVWFSLQISQSPMVTLRFLVVVCPGVVTGGLRLVVSVPVHGVGENPVHGGELVTPRPEVVIGVLGPGGIVPVHGEGENPVH